MSQHKGPKGPSERKEIDTSRTELGKHPHRAQLPEKACENPSRAGDIMIAQDKFEASVYSLLFPEGRIPLELKRNLGAMDARIAEIHSLAQGKHPTPKTRRIIEPTESAALTQRIMELRDAQPTPSWRDIARELGYALSSDAIRCRYQDAKALQEKEDQVRPAAGLQEAKPELSEKLPSQDEKKDENKETDIKGPGANGPEKEGINNSDHIVEPDEMVSQDTKQLQSSVILDLTKTGKYGRYEVPISDEVDAEIHRLSSGGMPTTGISNELSKKGILISWQRVRSVLATTARLKAKGAREEARKAEEAALRSAATTEDFGPPSDQARQTSPSPSHPGVEGAPELAREASRPTRGTPEETSEVKADRMILAMTKIGFSHLDISCALEREIGGIWRIDYVAKRIRELGAQL